MSQIFKDNQDITLRLHAAIRITDPSKITKEMRRDAKTINFGCFMVFSLSSERVIWAGAKPELLKSTLRFSRGR